MAKQERAVRSRSEFVNLAGEVFAENSYSAATIAMVLKGTSLSQGALYFHFKDKKALASAVILEGREALQSIAESNLRQSRNPFDSLEDLFFDVAETIRKTPVVAASLRLMLESGMEFPDVSTDMFSFWAPYTKELLERAVKGGHIEQGIQIDDLNWLIISAFMGSKEILSFRKDLDALPATARIVTRTVRSLIEIPLRRPAAQPN